MTWKLHIPYPHRNPDAALDAETVAEVLRGMEDSESRAVATEVLLEALFRGVPTFRHLIAAVEAAPPEERRKILARKREAAGLPTTERVDAERNLKMWRRARAHVVERDEAGRAFLICAHPDCKVAPLDPTTGIPTSTEAKKWWCSEHQDEAAPGDMDKWERRMRYSASGAIEDIDEVEAEQRRQEQKAESLRAKREHQAAERAPEAEEYRQRQAARDEFYRPRGAGWE